MNSPVKIKKKETNLVFSALPYAHGPLHLGRIIGSLLPADVMHRALVLRGQSSVFMTGTDMYGEGVKLRAQKFGKRPEDLSEEYHNQFKKDLMLLSIEPDFYTQTSDPKHHEYVLKNLNILKQTGILYPSEGLQYYCRRCACFKNSRSTCVLCRECGRSVRDDVCEYCWQPNNISSSDSATCIACGDLVEIQTVQNLKVDISTDDTNKQNVLRNTPTKYHKSLYNCNRSKAKDILRYIDYGIRWNAEQNVPVVYVWVEALLSYLRLQSELRIDHSTSIGRHYFIGKDNVYFHAEVLSTLYDLMKFKDVENNRLYVREYLLSGHDKMSSSSTNSALSTVPELLLLGLTSSSIRLYCASIDPLSSDSEFKLDDLIVLHNTVYCNKFMNFLHRIRLICDGVQRVTPPTEVCDLLNRLENSLVSSHLNRAYYVLIELIDYSNASIAEYTRTKSKTSLNTGISTFSLLCTAISPLVPELSNNSRKIIRFEGQELHTDWTALEKYTRL